MVSEIHVPGWVKDEAPRAALNVSELVLVTMSDDPVSPDLKRSKETGKLMPTYVDVCDSVPVQHDVLVVERLAMVFRTITNRDARAPLDLEFCWQRTLSLFSGKFW